ncbi:hypothetical protein D931_03386 [Enterococcus faecium 13.SD.W.09]|nr:hypothetical protein D931_03386 [Enterococcus faecium 13.SD.W.09]
MKAREKQPIREKKDLQLLSSGLEPAFKLREKGSLPMDER